MMRWLLAGLSFAALVALAVGTVAVRADCAIQRNRCARRYSELRDHLVERRRLEAELLDTASWRRLAEVHWRELRRESERRQGLLQ